MGIVISSLFFLAASPRVRLSLHTLHRPIYRLVALARDLSDSRKRYKTDSKVLFEADLEFEI